MPKTSQGKADYYLLAIILLSAMGTLALVGSIVLSLFNKETPDALVNLAFAAIGALGGIVAPKPVDVTPVDDKKSELEIIGAAATRSLINEAMRQMGILPPDEEKK